MANHDANNDCDELAATKHSLGNGHATVDDNHQDSHWH
jgi:hypothetical protein